MRTLRHLLILINLGASLLCSPDLMADQDFTNFDLNEAFNESYSDLYSFDFGEQSTTTKATFLEIENEAGEVIIFSERDITRLEVMLDSYNEVKDSQNDDKIRHVSAGRFGSLFMQSVCDHSGLALGSLSKRQTSFLCGLGAATTAGILKEVYDSTGRGQVDFVDAAATSIGGVWFEMKF